jgi:hypothetical protein
VSVKDVTPVIVDKTPKVPVMKVGAIKKEGHMIKNLKSRHFVLLSDDKESMIRYYAKSKSTSPYGEDEKGSMSLKGCEIQRTGGDIILKGKDNYELKLRFDSETEKESWVAAIRTHIAYARNL